MFIYKDNILSNDTIKFYLQIEFWWMICSSTYYAIFMCMQITMKLIIYKITQNSYWTRSKFFLTETIRFWREDINFLFEKCFKSTTFQNIFFFLKKKWQTNLHVGHQMSNSLKCFWRRQTFQWNIRRNNFWRSCLTSYVCHCYMIEKIFFFVGENLRKFLNGYLEILGLRQYLCRNIESKFE